MDPCVVTMNTDEMLERVHAILMSEDGGDVVHSLSESLGVLVDDHEPPSDVDHDPMASMGLSSAMDLDSSQITDEMASKSVVELEADLAAVMSEFETIHEEEEAAADVKASESYGVGYENNYSPAESVHPNENGISENEDSGRPKAIFRFYYGCNSCVKSFYDLESLVRHRRVAHDHGAKRACRECYQSIQDEENLSRGHVCRVCNKVFDYPSRLRAHLAKHYEHQRDQLTDESRRCPICQKSFLNKSYVEVHLRTHKGEKPFICKICGKGYSQKNYLAIHHAIHTNEKLHTCKLCGKSFTFKCSLNVHMNSSVHNVIRPVICPICNKDFTMRNQLRQHLKKKHDTLTDECIEELLQNAQYLSFKT